MHGGGVSDYVRTDNIGGEFMNSKDNGSLGEGIGFIVGIILGIVLVVLKIKGII